MQRSGVRAQAKFMKARFWVGVAVVVLGLASMFVSVPRSERRQIAAGDVSIGVELQHRQHIPRVVSVALIVLGGALVLTGVPTA
jgi:hypothetical protein